MRPATKTLVVATKNRGKAREFSALFEPLGWEVRSLNDYDRFPDIVEDGDTFAANALIKARAVVAALGVPALADDSGLCVDALDGAPGVYSARYAGEPADDAANNAKLIAELKRRGALLAPAEAGRPALLSAARFVCALAYAEPGGRVRTAEGVCAGAIVADARGANGFGYDPHFYLPEFGLTMAELTAEQKNAVSHRAQALRQMISFWEE
ncbi:purine NTP phosphatase [Gordoniibacillus kamchatkensis]|uniref:dITP/XTP pyrophosphatase n=1 Tax=Gordoniibacillus kamchatkensis TaxID=1590651 RepID=A0ABR5AIU8_9BACL|nr:XTP/dITP diphosphatase [Paenibacillus sp. VKM B-2647]KIL40287.1 purine NTP phosphatase [Paenibacillus sp. VKM B-2647]